MFDTPDLFTCSRARKGVTPVIAIVLLLMMTVAAAGGAYTWFSQMQQDIMEQAESDLQTSLSVKDLQCNVDVDASGNDEIVLSLKNDGQRAIEASQVDLFAYDSNQQLNITVTNMDWSGNAFTNTGGFDTVTVWVNQSSASDFLESGDFYSIEVDFTTTGTTVNAGSCVAQS